MRRDTIMNSFCAQWAENRKRFFIFLKNNNFVNTAYFTTVF